MRSSARRSPPLVEAMLDVQICSGVLEALTGACTSLTRLIGPAAQPSMSGLRDAFEDVSAAVIRTLVSAKDIASRHVSPASQSVTGPDALFDTSGQSSFQSSFGGEDFRVSEGDPTWDALNAYLMQPSATLSANSTGYGLFDTSGISFGTNDLFSTIDLFD